MPRRIVASCLMNRGSNSKHTMPAAAHVAPRGTEVGRAIVESGVRHATARSLRASQVANQTARTIPIPSHVIWGDTISIALLAASSRVPSAVIPSKKNDAFLIAR